MRLACSFSMMMALGVSWVPGVARADSSTGVASADDSGTASGSTGGTGGTEGCGTCEEVAAPVVIVSPADGDEVPADSMVTVEVNYACSCDDCGCYEDHPASFTLLVDGAEVFACFDGCTNTFVEDLNLSPGPHQITATAVYSFHEESVTINVTVPGAGATEGGASEGSGGTGDGGSGGGSGGGGSCRVETSPPGSPLALGLGLLALGAVGRRVRRRR